jgi:membrane protein YfhO
LLRVGRLGALAGGVVYALGQNVGATDCCTNHLQLSNWLPVALIGIELARSARRWCDRLPALALAATAVSQMIAGWLGQGTYYAALALGSYLAVRRIVMPPAGGAGWRQRILSCAIDGGVIGGLGVGLSAAGLLPRLDVVRRTFVGSEAYQGAEFTADRGWGWWTTLRVTAGYRPEWHPYYVGGAALACAIIALLVWRRSSVVPYFLALVAVVVILPLRPTPLHRVFYLLPRFRGLHLHDPGRVLAILPMGMSVLVAVAVDGLPVFLRRRWAIVLPLVPCALWAYLMATAAGERQPIAGITSVAIFAMSGVLAVALMLIRIRAPTVFERWVRLRPGRGKQRPYDPSNRSGWSTRWQRSISTSVRIDTVVPVLLIAILFVDPTGYALVRPKDGPRDESSVRAAFADIPGSVIRSAITANASREDIGGAGEFLQQRQAAESEPFRYFGYVAPSGEDWQEHERYMEPDVLPLLTNARSIRLGLQEIQGYDPAHLVRYRLFFEAINGLDRDYHEELVYPSGVASPLLNLLNVRYIVVPRQQHWSGAFRLDVIALSARHREVFQNGKIRVLENDAALPRAWIVHRARTATPDAILDLLTSGIVDPRQTALLETTGPSLDQPDRNADESVTVARYEDERIRLTVHAAADGLVVLSEVYDPGWHVFVDERRTHMYSADYLLRGVAVSAGDHVVEFRYEPASLRIGIIISTLAFLLAATMVGWSLTTRLRMNS